MTLRIGTCGWDYAHWSGAFYPEGLPHARRLEFASRAFSSLEIDSSFYRLPAEHTLEQWRDSTPEDFVFALKASRYITHMKKLKDAGEALGNVLGRAEALGEKLGPIVFQLPPHWRVDAGRLASFLDLLPGGFRFAFEFRDRSWFTEDVYRLLGEHEAAFCIFDLGGARSPEVVTSDLVYLRLHGPGAPYQGRYAQEALAGYAGRIRGWLRAGLDVCCYFDNDEHAYAAVNAAELLELTAPRAA